ncbi:UNVERIFIED_CONTAM: hypothetical protein GTU68_044894 [Idotea baltica]|nr:hypothetical protein [Idotea baltica]
MESPTQLIQHIEALIFASKTAITFEEVKSCLDKSFETEFTEEEILDHIHFLQNRYQDEAFGFDLVHISDGYQYLTKGAYHNSVGVMLRENSKRRLSKVALETLAILAYKQPVTKSELEKIRGVSCDYGLQKLLEKELVNIVGRNDAPGRPLLYGTTEKFMDYFGLGSLQELPKPKEFELTDNVIGEEAPIEENTIDEEVNSSEVEEMVGEMVDVQEGQAIQDSSAEENYATFEMGEEAAMMPEEQDDINSI